LGDVLARQIDEGPMLPCEQRFVGLFPKQKVIERGSVICPSSGILGNLASRSSGVSGPSMLSF